MSMRVAFGSGVGWKWAPQDACYNNLAQIEGVDVSLTFKTMHCQFWYGWEPWVLATDFNISITTFFEEIYHVVPILFLNYQRFVSWPNHGQWAGEYLAQIPEYGWASGWKNSSKTNLSGIQSFYLMLWLITICWSWFLDSANKQDFFFHFEPSLKVIVR